MNNAPFTSTTQLLETTNNNALNKNQRFLQAKQNYDEIIKYAINFINRASPVSELTISRHYYYKGQHHFDENDTNIYYLSGVSLNPTIANSNDYICKFNLTAELQYILITEGWKRSSTIPNAFFSIYIKRNGIPFY